jgi:uncharacterized protein YoxC
MTDRTIALIDQLTGPFPAVDECEAIECANHVDLKKVQEWMEEAAKALQEMKKLELDTLQATVERDAMRQRVKKLKNEMAWRDDLIRALRADNAELAKVIPELNRMMKEAVIRAETAEGRIRELEAEND